MSNFSLHFITAACWLALTAVAWRSLRVAGGSDSPKIPILEHILLPVGLALHGSLLYFGIVTPTGLDLGLANAVSLIVWLTVGIYWLGGLALPGIAGAQRIWAPLAFVAVLLQAAGPSGTRIQYGSEPLFALHFGIAMLAYSLFIVAAVHALVMQAEEKWLRRGTLPPMFRGLPPLLEMEALLFRILTAAFVLLTLTLATGVFFSEQVFGKPFQFTHKTVFGMLSWLIFGALLVGRHLWGWRGRRAVTLTLGGFAVLLLSYIGTKFVLEFILRRG